MEKKHIILLFTLILLAVSSKTANAINYSGQHQEPDSKIIQDMKTEELNINLKNNSFTGEDNPNIKAGELLSKKQDNKKDKSKAKKHDKTLVKESKTISNKQQTTIENQSRLNQLKAEQKQLKAEQRQLRTNQLKADQKQLRASQLKADQKRLKDEQKQLKAEQKQLKAEQKRLNAEQNQRITNAANIRALRDYQNWSYYHSNNGNFWNGSWNGNNYKYPSNVSLGTTLASLPSTIATILDSLGLGTGLATEAPTNYYYNDGIYYTKDAQGFIVTQPHTGVQLSQLPDGYIPVSMNNNNDKYYYYFGTFYNFDRNSNRYVVIDPPIGAIVPYIPDGFEERKINGYQLLRQNNTYYLPQQEHNKTVFRVVNPNKL